MHVLAMVTLSSETDHSRGEDPPEISKAGYLSFKTIFSLQFWLFWCSFTIHTHTYWNLKARDLKI